MTAVSSHRHSNDFVYDNKTNLIIKQKFTTDKNHLWKAVIDIYYYTRDFFFLLRSNEKNQNKNKQTNKMANESQQKMESCQLHVPPLDELADVLRSGLALHFSEVDVEIVDCPDLSQSPFHLAAPGMQNPSFLILSHS